MTLASSTSSSKRGATLKALVCAMALILLAEILSPASLRGEPSLDEPGPLNDNSEILIVGDSRSGAISPSQVAEAWNSSPEVEVYSMDGSHIESVARFTMSRQAKPPRLLVMCVSYSGYYNSPHGTNSRLNRFSDSSSFVSWKNQARESLRSRSALYLDRPVLTYLDQLRNWAKSHGSSVPKIEPSDPPSVDDENKAPTLSKLDLLGVHNQYRKLTRRVIPAYRDRQFEDVLEQWKSQGTKVVFLRLPVSGELKVIEDNSPFLGIFRPLAERHKIPFIDLNTFEWCKEIRQFMPDQSHIYGKNRRLRMSRRIGELLQPLDPAAR